MRTSSSDKVPGMLGLKEHAPASAIVAALAPRAGELVVRKNAAFGVLRHHAGALADAARRRDPGRRRMRHQRLRARQRRRCDVLGLRAVVVSDCVGDRAIGTARGEPVRHVAEVRRGAPIDALRAD